MKVRFEDLDWWLKIAVVLAWVYGVGALFDLNFWFWVN